MSNRNRKRRSAKNTIAVAAAPHAVQQLVQTVKEAAHGQLSWDDVATQLGKAPELWPVLDLMRAKAEARGEGGVGGSNRDIAALATKSASKDSGNPVAGSQGVAPFQSTWDAVSNVRVLRAYSVNDPWVRAVINLRRQQVSHAEIACVPNDPRKWYDKAAMKTISDILRRPNEMRQNWNELIGSALEDHLVMDRGCLAKGMTVKRQPQTLYAIDGAYVKINTAWDGDTDDYRYKYEPPAGQGKPTYLRNDELICLIGNPATHRQGLSHVQVLIDTIQRDIDASASAAHVVSQKPPPQIIHVEGAGQKAITTLRNTYDTEIAGKKQMMWVGGEGAIHTFPMVYSLTDQQWQPWLLYLARQICAIFQCSPQQVGITFDINKATAGAQQDNYEDTGLIPLFLLIEMYLNNEFVADFAPRNRVGYEDWEKLNLRLIFPKVSEDARMLHARETIAIAKDALGGLPSMVLNDILRMRGEEPVAGGNAYYVMTKDGAKLWLPATESDYLPGETTGGELGEQDPAGGPESDADAPTDAGDDDSAPNFNDDSDSGGADGGAADSSANTSQKMYEVIRFDARPFGQVWSPAHDKWLKIPVKRKSKTDKPKKDLHEAVRRVFNDAAQKGA